MTKIRLIVGLLVMVTFWIDASNAIQIDAEISGVETKVRIISLGADRFRIHWNNRGVLESSASPHGPWVEESKRASGIETIRNVSAEGEYFRVTQAEEVFTREPAVLHIPDSYDASKEYMLIIGLHYFTYRSKTSLEPLEFLEQTVPLLHLVDDKQFLYLTPQGIFDSNSVRGAGWAWNATEQCCVFDQKKRMFFDDEGYLLSVLGNVVTNFSVDLDRVSLVGGSNGGLMAMQMLCQYSELFAAGVALSSYGWSNPADCVPSEPVHVLRIDGSNDEEGIYSGGVSFSGFSKNGQ